MRFNRFLSCRICWRVALSVFLTIFTVVIIALIPIYSEYEKDQLTRLDEAGLALARSLFLLEKQAPDFSRALSQAGNNISTTTPLKAAIIYTQEGQELTRFGKFTTEELQEMAALRQNPRKSYFYQEPWLTVIWEPNELDANYTMVAQLDVQYIKSTLSGFFWHIELIVLIVGLFTTLITLLIVGIYILRPILLLREKIHLASLEPNNPEKHQLSFNRADELGDVIYGFNYLLQQSSLHMKKINEQEQALQSEVARQTKELLEKNQALIKENQERRKAEEETKNIALLHRQQAETIQYMSSHDATTHLPNRILFTDLLEQLVQWAQASKRLVVLFTLNIIKFTEIRQGLNQEQQTELIQQLAQRLRKVTSKRAIFGRIAESEFALALGDFSEVTRIYHFAQELFSNLNHICAVAGHEINITFNMGIAIYPIDATDSHELMRDASLALYYASVETYNNCLFYQAEMNQEMAKRNKLLSELYRALERNQLSLYYQGQINVQKKMLYGFEALLRWQHPEYGLISPTEFIPLAEESDLIVKIGEWAIKEVISQCMVWEQKYKLHLRAAINLSIWQLQDKQLAVKIKKYLEAYQCDAHLIELEITESTMMNNLEEVSVLLEQLNVMGIGIAIDDFGTGYSSMSYLKNLPVTSLKIDKSFVHDILNHPDAQVIIKAIIQLGHSLNLTVIVEGVENIKQLELLQSYGCDVAQGYFINEPQPKEQFEKMLLDKRR